ncbi:MAG: putative MAPEG superfamily protein [Kiritimatiellia bacterium]|jgi:uncharacterized MAPEG superfamily protein
MTLELWLLIASAGLCWTLIIAAATPNLLSDPVWAAGNRDTEAPASEVVKRMGRVAENMKENLPFFAIVVIVVHLADSSNWLSTLGAEIFVGARVVHAIVYILGVPWLRTGIWAVSIVGIGMMVATLFM